MEIAQSGNHSRLAKNGAEDLDLCSEAWEQIIVRNSVETGDFTYHEYLELVKSYSRYVNEYTLVTACLLKVAFFPLDARAGKILKQKGYKLDTGSAKRFEESLQLAAQQSKNLNTKLVSAYKQIMVLAEQNKKSTPVSFEAVLANLVAALEINVDRNITLAGYNEFKKIIKRKENARRNKFNKR